MLTFQAINNRFTSCNVKLRRLLSEFLIFTSLSFIHTHTHSPIYMEIYIYIYIYIYTHTHTHTHTFRFVLKYLRHKNES